MAKGASIVIVGAQREEEAILREQIEDLGEILGVEPDPHKAYELIKRRAPNVVVLFLDHDPHTILQISGQLQHINGCAPMIVSRDRDPDKILQAMRSGAKDFAYLEQGNTDVRRAILNIAITPKATPQPGERGTVVAVFSCKGGSGATTIATGLAGALLPEGGAAKGEVVLLDLDFQMGDVLIFLDIASRYTWRDLINNLHRLDEDLLHQSLTLHPCGLHVVAQSDALEEADDIEAAGVAKTIALLRRHFKYVVIDGLRDFSETALLVLDMADRILLTMTQDLPALKNANRCLTVLRDLGYGRDKLKLVLNRHQKRGQLDVDAIADALGMPVDGMVSNDFPTVIKAVNEGTLLSEAAPRARVTKDIVDLVPLVRQAEEPTEQPRRRGLFRRG